VIVELVFAAAELVLAVVGTVTRLQVAATAAMARLEPTRPSRPGPRPDASLVSTQRTRPDCTAFASQLTLTWLSRPEKPPIPATSAPLEMIWVAAPCWLETAIVPPPCLLT
jgi:hypothetical protein